MFALVSHSISMPKTSPSACNRFLLSTGWAPTNWDEIFTAVCCMARASHYIAGLTALNHHTDWLTGHFGAGYLGGWVDTLLMRLVDIFLAFPSLILALAFVAALGTGIPRMRSSRFLSAWPPIARLARAETLAIRRDGLHRGGTLTREHPPGIIVRHIIPMCLPSVIVRVTR
ncbi:ABC transporter permease subunit (plasmid) [Pseudomonas silvicola]|nr:ABC transporter permease subunit [Pseudomonas silvicola]